MQSDPIDPTGHRPAISALRPIGGVDARDVPLGRGHGWESNTTPPRPGHVSPSEHVHHPKLIQLGETYCGGKPNAPISSFSFWKYYPCRLSGVERGSKLLLPPCERGWQQGGHTAPLPGRRHPCLSSEDTLPSNLGSQAVPHVGLSWSVWEGICLGGSSALYP